MKKFEIRKYQDEKMSPHEDLYLLFEVGVGYGQGWEHAKFVYETLVDRLVSLALERRKYKILCDSSPYILVEDNNPKLYLTLTTSELRQLTRDIEKGIQEKLKRRMKGSLL